ncbi:glutamine synthetase [Candidatus Peregrinibacteria bacterium]|nr:glutamine synthetase [Candidatus Peregrinibacteria bacterium]
MQSEISGRERDYDAVLWKTPHHLLDLSYAELEEKNLGMKRTRTDGVSSDEIKDEFLGYLKEENGIKAVTVCFSDLEGRFHALDYDKNYLIGAEDNLTFDGSSIHGFTAQNQSDLRLKIDWTTTRWLPSDLLGVGKILVFGNVCDKDGSMYDADFRSKLLQLSLELKEKREMTINVAPEIEGFLFDGVDAEQNFDENVGFKLVTKGGYFNALPQDALRQFIDKFAEVQRSLAFQNEKDHPEVAPSQFELNFRYSTGIDTADQILMYKLLAKQVAKTMGFTACFLPKPIQNLNGTGMHTNISLSKNGENLFYDKEGKYFMSQEAYRFIAGVLYYANDICLVMNSSVNAYRRLDPHFEAPNEIKVSAIDRGSMVRIPIGNEKSARVEVRTVAPDVNPYLCIYSIVKAGLKGIDASDAELKKMEEFVYGEVKKLPGDIYAALDYFEKSEFMKEIMGKDNHRKYAELKRKAADRSPKGLGTKVKIGEILYHHEVTNQMLWADF